MYKMYRTWATNRNVRRLASERQYREIFNRSHNLGFFLPRKDQCEACKRWRNAKNNAERAPMLTERKLHLINYKRVNQLKNSDKATANVKKCVASFDLQKVLNCPRSETSVFFYKNKLSIFNFTVFDLQLQEGYYFL